MDRCGRIAFFKSKRGEYTLDPIAQGMVNKILKEAGIAETFGFDKYKYKVWWRS